MLASQTYLEKKKRKNGFELLHDAAKKLAPLLEDTCSLSFTQAADIASEIPGVGVDYSSVHVVRTILKLRQAWGLDPIAFDPEAWNRNKGMNRRTTYKAFEYMAIRTQEDADLLLTAVKTSLQNAASSRTTKALINTLKSWELPCPACEEIGMLDAMGNVAGWSFPSTHRGRAEWILARLPATTEDLVKLRWKLLGHTWQDPLTRTGADHGAAKFVLRSWLNNVASQRPLAKSALDLWRGVCQPSLQRVLAVRVPRCIVCEKFIASVHGAATMHRGCVNKRRRVQ